MKRLTSWLVGMALLAGACAADPTVSGTDPSVGPDTSGAGTGSVGTVADTVGTGPSGAGSGSVGTVTGDTDGAVTVDTAPGTVTVVGTTIPGGPAGLFASQLVEFNSCDAFLDRLKAEALERVGPYGFNDGVGIFRAEIAVEAEVMLEAAADSSAEQAGGPGSAAGVDYSTTNVQEAGVDEPDLVKTDGRRILALARGVLHYIDVTSGAPALVSSIDLGSQEGRYAGNHQMFLSGDTALLMSSGYSDEAGEITLVHQIDLSEPEAMQVTRTLTAEGRFVSARLIGEQANLVLSSDPAISFEFVYPSGNSEGSKRRAEQVNRLVIQESTLEDWMPRYELTGDTGSAPPEGMLVDCSKAYAPQEFSGFSFLSVMAVDLSEGIEVGAVATVVSGGDTVYASQDNLYVATQRWIDWGIFDDEQLAREEAEAFTTRIHRFAIGGPGGPEYTASGSVDGFLLNQFAMSEHNGYLRVASTDRPGWGWWGDDTESRVDVLEQDGRELRVAGSVSGLGEGETIFAVRFIGDVGYVVTFRQTDPLYTIDLSDPANPQVIGELKILGYSAYLHPIGDGLLLGVGQDADEQGVVSGTQVSVFDVSDLADPVRIHQYTLAESSRSEVEFDHRAFLYWPRTGTVVLPVSWWEHDEDGDFWRSFYGAKVLEIGDTGIEDKGFIEHRPSWAREDGEGAEEDAPYFEETVPIRRSLVIGQNLFTLSEGGLKASDIGTLSDLSWVEFPFEGYPPAPEPLS